MEQTEVNFRLTYSAHDVHVVCILNRDFEEREKCITWEVHFYRQSLWHNIIDRPVSKF